MPDPLTSRNGPRPRLAAAGRRARDRLDGRAARALLSRGGRSCCVPVRLRPRASSWIAVFQMVDLDGRAAAEAAGRRLPSAPRPRATDSGAMLAHAMAHFAAHLQSATTRPPSTRTRRSSAARRCRSRRQRGDPRAARTALEPPRIRSELPNAKRRALRRRRSGALHYSRVAGDSPSGTAGLDWALIHRPAPGGRGAAGARRDRRGPARWGVGPAAGGAARDARPHRRGVAARPRRARITCAR